MIDLNFFLTSMLVTRSIFLNTRRVFSSIFEHLSGQKKIYKKTAGIIRIFLAQGEQSKEVIVLEDKDTIRNSSRDCV